MYLVYSVVPHFTSKKLGPYLPRQTGYSSDHAGAMQQAKTDQGFVRSMNQNIDGSWR